MFAFLKTDTVQVVEILVEEQDRLIMCIQYYVDITHSSSL